MAFDDRSLRFGDSPKKRVLSKAAGAKCKAVYWNGRCEGYLVILDKKTIGTGRTAYDAWLDAEAKLESAV